MADEETRDTPLTVAAKQLDELLRHMGFEATVIIENEASPQLLVQTEDAARLIGHRGDGMRAIQHIVRLMVLREGHDVPVIVDVDGYRKRQHEQLQETAKHRAEEVKRTGRLATFPPMSSYERRLVHKAVADIDGVMTESNGEGRQRRIVIKPA